MMPKAEPTSDSSSSDCRLRQHAQLRSMHSSTVAARIIRSVCGFDLCGGDEGGGGGAGGLGGGDDGGGGGDEGGGDDGGGGDGGGDGGGGDGGGGDDGGGGNGRCPPHPAQPKQFSRSLWQS